MLEVSCRLVPSLLLSALALSAGRGQQAPALDDAELQALATSLATYFEARLDDAGVAEAETALLKGLEVLRGATAADPLRRGPELGRALWLARKYSAGKLKKGKVTSEVLRRGSFTGAGLEYAYRTPKDYDPKRKAYPLVLTIPDADEAPAEHIRTHWIHGELLEQAILLSPAMPADPAEWEHVAVQGRPAGLSHVLTVLDLALETFALDFDRIYVAGRGKSVAAALAAANHAPQRFAGVIGRAGDAGDLAADNFTNLPSFFAPGGPKAGAFRNALGALGADVCRIDELEDEAALWSWLQEHPRRTRPETVNLVAGKPFPTRAYWLRIAPSAPDARATATVDRAINTIRVSTVGVSQVTLYLDDVLLDLDKPVCVMLDGVDKTAPIPRRLATTLELLHDGTSDPACVYVAEAVCDAGELAAAGGSAPRDAEFEELWTAAGERVEGLWELHAWCAANGRAAQDERVLRKLLRLAPDHAEARAALGQRGSPGRWFPSQEALDRYLRSQDKDVAEARGLVLDRGAWIHRDERALAVKGLVKDAATGVWLSQGDVRRLGEGWVRQDLTWIPPADVPRVDEGLWLVDGEWVDLATANRRHARIDFPWHVPSREVLLHSTADRAVALRALEHMGRAVEDLVKVFGAVPALPLEVTLLRDEEQYDRFAFGDPDGRRRATDASRMHLVHSAYFAESWFARVGGKPAFRGMGVCLWDPLAPNGDLFGVHAARLALGLSYAEALDPSPKAVQAALASGPGAGYLEAYRAEKVLPAWLRIGGAVYAERFFSDASVGDGGDPLWARRWSMESLAGRGGLRDLAEVLAFRIDPDDREDGLRRLLEAGLVVAFIVDGNCAPVAAAHRELKRALAGGELRASHVKALTDALVANEEKLKLF